MSTATQPTTAKGHATRERLLAAARELAIASGGHVEIASVAAAAGVVPSLVHRYFGIDLDAVWSVVEAELPALRSSIESVLGGAGEGR